MSQTDAAIAVVLSVSGGQGKTLTTYMLGLRTAGLGVPTLVIDGDPQHNLTDFLRFDLQSHQPTLLEVLKGEVAAEDAIYPVPGRENLFLIPSDRALGNAQQYLMGLPNSAAVLRSRLKPVRSVFGAIYVDTPPQKSHITLTAIGAATCVVIPVEAAAKGVGSLDETQVLLEDSRSNEAFNGELIGVLPFRAKWTGLTPTTDTRENIDLMKSIVGEELVLPPLRESELYKQALNFGSTPAERSGEAGKILEYPFDVLLQRLSRFAPMLQREAVV